MLCTNLRLLSLCSELFGGLAVAFTIAACVLAIVGFCRDLARGSGWIWSGLAGYTVFAQLCGFGCLGDTDHLARLVSSALLAAAGLALSMRRTAEAYPL